MIELRQVQEPDRREGEAQNKPGVGPRSHSGQTIKSKHYLGADLDISGLADCSRPFSEVRAGQIFVKRPPCTPSAPVDKPVPVPDIEEFTSDLEVMFSAIFVSLIKAIW